MDINKRNKGNISEEGVLKSRSFDETPAPPWLFRHDDLIKALSSASLIEKEKLANILNYIHFTSGHISVLLQHPEYEEGILVNAYPEPCLGDELTCRWDQTYASYNLERYHFEYLIIAHNMSIIVAPAKLVAASGEGIIAKLPEKSYLISKRHAPRFICRDINAELLQNGFHAKGELLDFSSNAFRIKVKPAPPASFHWFNPEAPSAVRLSNGEGIFFSGNCRCLHQKQDNQSREIVLVPLQDQIKRFPARVLRNPRRQASPPFYAIFEHPFFKKKVQREIYDISTSGFSICDKSDEAMMMPGMIIPDMTIVYAGILKIHCKTQVIYRKEEDGQVRFGIAILDMDLTNYNNLVHVLNGISGADTGMTNETDLDELWEFFFDTGFIYPKKYKNIQSFKDDFHDIYRRLYEEAPEIAKHFIYQDNGRIYGHISMLRAYERTWMVHHHAARSMGGRSMGLIVLKQLIYYLNDLRRLPSANMDYVITYFRPGNKFPERIFGGFAKEEANPQHCSLDLFTYLTYPTGTRYGQLPGGWSLRECSTSDMWEFEQFYKHHSGGLFWNVLNPGDGQKDGSLEKVYAETGFIRRWKFFALASAGNLKAFIVAEESDAGINLSNLL
ncbi:MAG: PilZ domain-containing protein, partial [Syntrophales bacterium]|nr:PilZ domain-containing protein [Syntrophales bacterium]